MNFIDHIPQSSTPFRVPGRVGIDTPSFPQEPSTAPVLDHELTVYQEGISWKFRDGKVLISGLNAEQLISNRSEDVGYWMGLAEGMVEYRKKVMRYARENDRLRRFGFVIEGLLGKILGRLKKVYDQKTSGIHWSMEDGQFIMNGINIRSFLALYRVRKTDKARKFLRGIRGRLFVLLENRQESPDYERIRNVVEDLRQEIDGLLAPEETPRPIGYLPPPRTHHS